MDFAPATPQYRGIVEFASKPPGHERYRCYEKRVA